MYSPIKSGFSPSFFEKIYITLNYEEKNASYGVYEFVISGWESIVSHFRNSVIPIISKNNYDENIGSSFVYASNNYLVTARHNISKGRCFKLLNSANQPVQPSMVCVSKDESLDLAILGFWPSPFGMAPPIRGMKHNLAEPIICLGYPPIPGFVNLIISQPSEIVAFVGNVLAHENSYIEKQDYIIISNKIKGGNSGGPVINSSGALVGVVTDSAIAPEHSSKFDSLGYGVATPYPALKRMMDDLLDYESDRSEIVQQHVEYHADGWVSLPRLK